MGLYLLGVTRAWLVQGNQEETRRLFFGGGPIPKVLKKGTTPIAVRLEILPCN